MSRVRAYVDGLVSQDERPLKTKALDRVEFTLLVASGLTLLTFTVTVFLDVVTRLLGNPILWLQEATLIAFVWGTFIGASVGQRRSEHFVVTSVSGSAGRLRRTIMETIVGVVLIAVGVCVAVFGYQNFQQGFGNHLPVTGLPLATLTGAIPVFGLLLTLFATERLVQGWRHQFPPTHHGLVDEIKSLQGGHQ